MVKEIELYVPPSVVDDPVKLKAEICRQTAIDPQTLNGYNILKRSIDARKKPRYFLRVQVFVNETPERPSYPTLNYKKVNDSQTVIIVGMGPAGMFAALKALEFGIKPIIIERGKQVRDRRRDLAMITREHEVNPDSNYCFGEGGAGTYSDGKLYTRSKKRGDVMKILHLLVQHGADPNIMIDAHPHIGTNKLPGIIENIRETILEYGGEIRFNSKMTDLILKDGEVKGIMINNADEVLSEHVILATGHSARDVFKIMMKNNLQIDPKPFALGIRIEHPQEVIDKIQYNCDHRTAHLPPASYALVHQVGNRGVYSFCMCPGGIIAPCATNPGEVVTNGWSPSKRDNPYANSGVVVEVKLDDLNIDKYGPLAGVEFQSQVEKTAWKAGGEAQKVPAQRLMDYLNNKVSATIPDTSYIPGTTSYNLKEVLPPFVHHALQQGFRVFGKKMKAYLTNDAVLHATESRTSSPVRFPRDRETLEHPQAKGLYPCGEGAGYAGGIVSAAIDGIRCMEAVSIGLNSYNHHFK